MPGAFLEAANLPGALCHRPAHLPADLFGDGRPFGDESIHRLLEMDEGKTLESTCNIYLAPDVGEVKSEVYRDGKLVSEIELVDVEYLEE